MKIIFFDFYPEKYMINIELDYDIETKKYVK